MRDLLSKAMLLIFSSVSMQAFTMDYSDKENSINKIAIILPPGRTAKIWDKHAKRSTGDERLYQDAKLRSNRERIGVPGKRNPNTGNKEMQKILKVASSKDDFQSAYALLASGAKVNCILNETSPLHAATSARMGRFLMLNRANPNALDQFHLTPLQVALYQDKEDNALIEALLQYDSNPNGADFPGLTPLQIALTKKVRNWTVIETLLRYGANPDVLHPDGRTLLDIACANKKWHIIEFILSDEIDLNVLNERGYAPLHYACAASDRHSIELLLAKGADPFFEDKHGEMPIHKIKAKNTSLIKMLERKMFELSNK